MTNIIYDAGALIAAERGRREFLVMHRESLATEIDPIVPVVLARFPGPGDAESGTCPGCDVAATGERTARTAGAACGRAKTSDIVDAVVVVTRDAVGGASRRTI
ncbi:MAG: hypothetical protein ACRDQU_21860 [Pseudonocardiaceae bacterium]